MPGRLLKRFINSISIRNKLTLQILLASLIVLALAVGMISYASINTIKRDSITQTERVIGILGHDMIELLIIDNPDYAADLTSKLKAFDQLNRLFLYNMDGVPVFSYNADGQTQPAPEWVTEKHSRFTDDQLLAFRPLEEQGMRFGTVYLALSMEPLAESIAGLSMSLMFIILMVIPIALVLSRLFQKPFTQPILNLTETINSVTQTQDYGLRAITEQRNEVGELYRGFNNLLDTIDEAHNRLYLNTERQRQIYYSITDGIIAFNNDGIVETLNHAARKLTGWDMQDAQGKSIHEILAIYDSDTQDPFLLPDIGNLDENSRINVGNLNIVSRYGESFPVELTLSSLTDRHDQIQGILVVLRNVSDEQRLREQLLLTSRQDPLTGLTNRAELERRIQDWITHDKNTDLFLLHIDIDNFKIINENSGHAAGDELLKQAARFIESQCDTNHLCARIGGDEFAIAVRGVQLDHAIEFSDLLNQRAAQINFEWGGSNYPISLSIGIARSDNGPDALSQLLKNADTAHQIAVQHGGNQYRIYQSSDETMLEHRDELMMYTRIISALEEDRLELYFQKIMPLYDHNDRLHFEILVRMNCNDGQQIPPGLFIPVAERYRLANRIDRSVISKALKMLSQRPGLLARLDLVSINLSGNSLDDEEIAHFVLGEIEHNGFPGDKLCFEFTETSAITSLNNARNFMQQLRKSGCRFSLDDFGTGMSSLAYLKQFPVDYLKLDGAFVRDIEHDPIDFALVRSFNDIGHTLGMKTIAEFVENNTIRDKLDGIGIDYVQGYGIHRPEPLDQCT